MPLGSQEEVKIELNSQNACYYLLNHILFYIQTNYNSIFFLYWCETWFLTAIKLLIEEVHNFHSTLNVITGGGQGI
jgi:hypothetical protein